MILTFMAILLLALVFTGVGLLFPWSLFRKEPTFDHLLLAFWSGWAMVIGFLQVWHMFFRVGPAAFVIILAASLWGWAQSWRILRDMTCNWHVRHTLLLAVLGSIPALILANHVLFVPFNINVDHGLYHMQTVEWNSQYAIVPGLGNLHHRFAFNSSHFLYPALLDWGILEGRSYYVASTLLGYVLFLGCAASFYQLFRMITISRLFFALMIPVVMEYISSGFMAGYSSDVPIFMLHVVLAGEFLRLYENAWEQDVFHNRAMTMALLVGAGTTAKLSFAVFGSAILLAVVVLWVVRFRGPLRSGLPTWLAWAGIVLALVIPWQVRSVILSGYLFYPSPLLSLPVPWKIPLEFVDVIQPGITEWARTGSNIVPYTADLTWFEAWSELLPFIVRQAVMFTLALLLADLLLFGWLKQRAARTGEKLAPYWGAAVLFAVSAVSLVYWFVLAPSYRFSGAIFWLLLVSVVLFGFRLLAASELVHHPLRLAASLVLVGALWLSPNQFSNNLSRRLLLTPPSEKTLAEEAQPLSNAQPRTTRAGLTVYLPPNAFCLHYPLPCTPLADYLDNLALFEAGNLQRGLYLMR